MESLKNQKGDKESNHVPTNMEVDKEGGGDGGNLNVDKEIKYDNGKQLAMNMDGSGVCMNGRKIGVKSRDCLTISDSKHRRSIKGKKLGCNGHKDMDLGDTNMGSKNLTMVGSTG